MKDSVGKCFQCRCSPHFARATSSSASVCDSVNADRRCMNYHSIWTQGLRKVPVAAKEAFPPTLCRGVPEIGSRRHAKTAATVVIATAVGLLPANASSNSGEPWVARQVGSTWFEDFDCDHVRGSIVDWNELRRQIYEFDEAWHPGSGPPQDHCTAAGRLTSSFKTTRDGQDLLRRWSGEIGAVLRFPDEASKECPFGALAAVVLPLACESDCGGGNTNTTLTHLWHRLLEPIYFDRSTEAAGVYQQSLIPTRSHRPAYLLGTSAWPTASLLTKWGVNCTGRSSSRVRPKAAATHESIVAHTRSAMACHPAAVRFVRDIGRAALSTLQPLLAGAGGSAALIFDARLDYFAMAALPEVAELELHVGKSLGWASDGACAVEALTLEVVLMFLRLMGPPVAKDVDPLGPPRLARLGRLLASAPLQVLLRSGWPAMAILAVVRLTTWRSHRLYPGAQVTPADIRRALLCGADEIESGARALRVRGLGRHLPRSVPSSHFDIVQSLRRARPNDALSGSNGDIQRSLWRHVADGSLEACGGLHGIGASVAAAASRHHPPLGAVWRRVARWLLEAPINVPPVVYLTMFWGDMGSDRWVSAFLDRALSVGLPRLAFISPHERWLGDCERVSVRHQGEAGWSYRRLLCVRSFAPFARPYDVNNYAKFVLLPLLLSLGVDYAWLDVDIFLIRDPTERLLEIAYGEERKGTDEHGAVGAGGGSDVLTTDHFDEKCLNHGVIFVKASERTLLWALRYIEWMHIYPFGHDQNGWDAFLGHSIKHEPMVPDDPNVSLQILDTSLEFLTLTGWGGSDADIPRALLLHMTRTTPIGMKEKRQRLMSLLDAAADLDSDGLRTEVQTVLTDLRAPPPGPTAQKRECYEGVHVAVETMVHDGSYWNLFS
eukprot:TRINITY_DN36555_c0_g1_i1.p1 TRINITY_DN36555_c0_g1~~TRINITY_DN36555_c0_g1_i1.p1  ORF type:complete len:890 (-),score=114.17 TRINITY_DN36555_c0_g1_i1:105-2774(-)